MSSAERSPEQLLRAARAGDTAALGRLLEQYRNYLWLMARSQIGTALRVRLNPSDLVQETFLEAHRDFNQFAGSTEKELMLWLRRILMRNLADQARRHQAKGRNMHREQSLEQLLDRSSAATHQALVAGLSSPSVQAARREQAALVADALAHLPDDYREVIILRHLDRCKFDEIALRMGRSPGAVRMLWARALERLRNTLEGLA